MNPVLPRVLRQSVHLRSRASTAAFDDSNSDLICDCSETPECFGVKRCAEALETFASSLYAESLGLFEIIPLVRNLS